MRSRLVSWIRLALRQRFVGIRVASAPHFHAPETTSWFVSQLLKCRQYLEYGSGGSTCLAAQHAVPFISVDSDRRFLKAVEDRITALFPSAAALRIFRHADIGLTARWGFPMVLGRPSPGRLLKFARYSDPPAECADGRFRPDFILVDGRFRVACALKWVRLLGAESDWTIAVDDYSLRPHYGIIEKFAKLERLVGNMAVFKGALPHAAQDLDAAIRLYETDDA